MALWPAARAAVPSPLIRLKLEPEIVACAMFTMPVPVFVTLKLFTAALPVGTPPKASVVALAARTPAPDVVDCVEALVKPAQLVSVTAVRITARVATILASGRRDGLLD
ncbi:MAG: hypothetical protein WA581_04415 [Candidatus Acidiferrales bacterium]